MSTLKQDLKFGDWILNTKSKDAENLYFVISVDDHSIWVYTPGAKTPNELPIRMFNMTYAKVDPKTVKVLYGDKGIEVTSRQVDIIE